MLSWLKSKGENARVYMCTKELKWELESANALRRARILVLGQIVRATSFGTEPLIQDMLNRPLDYPRVDLVKLYEGIENIRNQSNAQLEHLKKVTPRIMTMEMPQFVIDRAKDAARGLEIWLCTLGAGIVPDRRDEVREIWDLLQGSMNTAPDAVVSLMRDDKQMQQGLTGIGSPGGETIWDDLSPEQVLAACTFVPSSFLKRLEG